MKRKILILMTMTVAMLFSCTEATEDSQNSNNGNNTVQNGNDNQSDTGNNENNNNQGNNSGSNENIGGTTENPIADSIYGEWIDKDLNLVYAINEDGSYSITQNGILIEDGNFEEENAGSRAARKTVTIKSMPKTSGGAKKSVTVPKATTTTISKSTESESISVGNTTLVQKDSLSNDSLKTLYVYVQSDIVPRLEYSFDDYNAKANISDVTCATKIDGISYRWYKFTIKCSQNFAGTIIRKDSFDSVTFGYRTTYVVFDYKGELTYSDSKPDNIFSDEDYARRNNLYYIRGNFEAGIDQYLATDGYNNMEEIERNIFKGTLYLPENVYGFKISTDDWEHDYCVPFDASFVTKNKWFDVVRSTYSVWYGKNAALSTSGGMYTFILDITDSENPQMMISSDEKDYEISTEDKALYVLGTFNNWKYDSSNGMMTETSAGTYEGTINISIADLCEFKIADKAWGAIIDDIGGFWGEEILLNTPTTVYGAYTRDPKGSTGNIVINFEETGNYKVKLVKSIDNYTLTVSKIN